MREIRFRAKTIKGGQWIDGDLFRAGTEPGDGEFAISYWDEESGWMNENVRPDTICQFTGLKDKNGTDIFEGDVLNVKLDPQWDYLGRFRGKTDIPPYLKAVVRYNERMCRFELLLEENEQCGDHHLVTCEIGWGHEEFLIVGKFIEMPFKLEIERTAEGGLIYGRRAR